MKTAIGQKRAFTVKFRNDNELGIIVFSLMLPLAYGYGLEKISKFMGSNKVIQNLCLNTFLIFIKF